MPEKNDFVVTRSNLAKRKRAILKIWKEKEKAKLDAKENKGVILPDTTSPYNAPLAYLKRETYRTVRTCWRTGAMDILHDGFTEALSELPQKGLIRPTPEKTENPFYIGLIYITANERTFNRNYRVRFSREMLYAHLHDVPPELLVGFLWQTGSSDEIGNRLANRQYEGWQGKLPLSPTAAELKRKKDKLAPLSSVRRKKR